MDTFRYFYFCDHKFPVTNDDGDIRNVTITNDGTLIDVLVNRARVLEILDVRVLEYDPLNPDPITTYDEPPGQQYDGSGSDKRYFDVGPDFNVDYGQYVHVDGETVTRDPLPATLYSRYLHNRIRWNVRPPKKYIVKLRVILTVNQFQTYDVAECPRCQGNLWFIDVLSAKGAFEEAKGIVRVTQRLIKDLFTDLGSNVLDLTAGTVLRRQVATQPPGATDEQLFNDFRLIVSGVEDRYLAMQSQETALDPTETLVHFSCAGVKRNAVSTTHVTVDLLVQTQAETRNLRIPF